MNRKQWQANCRLLYQVVDLGMRTGLGNNTLIFKEKKMGFVIGVLVVVALVFGIIYLSQRT